MPSESNTSHDLYILLFLIGQFSKFLKMSILVIFITGKENDGNYRHLYSMLKDLILILHVLSSISHLSISKVIGDADFQIWALKW
jgi:hypothetical protein